MFSPEASNSLAIIEEVRKKIDVPDIQIIFNSNNRDCKYLRTLLENIVIPVLVNSFKGDSLFELQNVSQIIDRIIEEENQERPPAIFPRSDVLIGICDRISHINFSDIMEFHTSLQELVDHILAIVRVPPNTSVTQFEFFNMLNDLFPARSASEDMRSDEILMTKVVALIAYNKMCSLNPEHLKQKLEKLQFDKKTAHIGIEQTVAKLDEARRYLEEHANFSPTRHHQQIDEQFQLKIQALQQQLEKAIIPSADGV